MLEEVREAGATCRLVLRADIVPDADSNHRRLAVGVNNDAKTIGEREGLVGNRDALDELRNGVVARLRCRCRLLCDRGWRECCCANQGEQDRQFTHTLPSPLRCAAMKMNAPPHS